MRNIIVGLLLAGTLLLIGCKEDPLGTTRVPISTGETAAHEPRLAGTWEQLPKNRRRGDPLIVQLSEIRPGVYNVSFRRESSQTPESEGDAKTFMIADVLFVDYHFNNVEKDGIDAFEQFRVTFGPNGLLTLWRINRDWFTTRTNDLMLKSRNGTYTGFTGCTNNPCVPELLETYAYDEHGFWKFYGTFRKMTDS